MFGPYSRYQVSIFCCDLISESRRDHLDEKSDIELGELCEHVARNKKDQNGHSSRVLSQEQEPFLSTNDRCVSNGVSIDD